MELNECRLGTVLTCKNSLVRAVVMAKCSTGIIVFNYITNGFEVIPYDQLDKIMLMTNDNMSMIDETNELRAFTSKFINATVDYMNEHHMVYDNIISNNDILKSSKDLLDKKIIDRKQVKDTRTNRIYSIVDVERINGKLFYSLNRVRSINRTLHEESLFIDSDELKEGFVFEEDLINPFKKNTETLENNEYISTGNVKELFKSNNDKTTTEPPIIDKRSDNVALLDSFNLSERFRKPVRQWHDKTIGTLSNTMMEKIYDTKFSILEYYNNSYLQFMQSKDEPITKFIQSYLIDTDEIQIVDTLNRHDVIKLEDLMDTVVCKNNKEAAIPFMLRCLTFIKLVHGKDYDIFDHGKNKYVSDITEINIAEIMMERYFKFRYNPIVTNEVGSIILYKNIPMVVTKLNKTSMSVLFDVFSDNGMTLAYLPYKLLDKLKAQGDIKILNKYNFTSLFNIVNEEYSL